MAIGKKPAGKAGPARTRGFGWVPDLPDRDRSLSDDFWTIRRAEEI